MSASLLMLAGCTKDWLDEKPNKVVSTPKTLKDLDAMLDNNGVNYSPLNLGDIGSDGHNISDARVLVGVENFIRVPYTWTKDRENKDVLFWPGTYSAVLSTNVILETLDKIKNISEAEMPQFNRIKGGALFQRARMFFELSQLFGAPYNESTAAKDLGIPLRLESNLNIKTKRSTVKEVYDLVISDLNKASKLLPSNPLYKTRAGKAASYGMLARVYLSMENYGSAGLYADSCLQLYSTLINFNSVSKTASNLGALNSEVIFHTAGNSFYTPSSDLIDISFYNSYQDDDLRKVIFFRKAANGTILFKGNYFNSGTQLFTGLATDELFLIRSECFARGNKVFEAMQDLNTLMKMRWSNTINPFPEIKATTKEEALSKILVERRKELLFRGQRWSDLRRLNKDPLFRVTITRTMEGKTFTLEPNSYKYVLPIPDDVIILSGIEQNPGWNK